jgi:hypothetical protein
VYSLLLNAPVHCVLHRHGTHGLLWDAELDVTIPADGAVATSFEEQYESDWAASA